jgi:hypothetical protein
LYATDGQTASYFVTFSASASAGFGLNSSSRPSAWEYRGFLTLIQCGDGLSIAFYDESFRFG